MRGTGLVQFGTDTPQMLPLHAWSAGEILEGGKEGGEEGRKEGGKEGGKERGRERVDGIIVRWGRER